MFKKTLVAGFMVSVLAGCSSIPGFETATVDRTKLNQELKTNCKELGKDFTKVSYAVDNVSKVMVSIQERQCDVLSDYRTMANKHGDVAGFLEVNADKSDEELRVAMDEFDKGKPQRKKIRPQVEAYKKASDGIFRKNVKLAADIALQAGEIALIAKDHATLIAKESGTSVITNLMSAAEETEVVPVVEAYNEMKARMDLVVDANKLIMMDKSTIDQLEKLDSVVADKARS